MSVPREPRIAELRDDARACRACPLWKPATQTVFGEGPDNARVMFIGEQPGDAEDLSGHPFVGPAGKLFDRALTELRIARKRVYVTNVVKHFKFEVRGKLRLHKRANAAEQAACRRWLDAELAALAPRRVVCLGAMAAQALLGRKFGLMRERGKWIEREDGLRVLATVHPSFVLRQRGSEARDAAYAGFVDDLAKLKD
jgi:DNA polymerase